MQNAIRITNGGTGRIDHQGRPGTAVVRIIRAADLSYIGRGTMGREKRRLPPPGDVTLF